MKHFIIYCYKVQSPRGGMEDYIGEFESAEEVYSFLKSLLDDLWQKVNSGETIMQVANLSEGLLLDLWWTDFTLDEIKDERYYKKIIVKPSFEFEYSIT